MSRLAPASLGRPSSVQHEDEFCEGRIAEVM